MISLPFLSKLDLASEPMTADWKGSLRHIGPVQTITPLVEMLGGKTTCGTLTLMSGVMMWCAARLQPYTEVSYINEISEAAFAWQHDWRYLNPKGLPNGAAPEQPAAISAAMTMRSMMINSISTASAWHSFFQPLMKASHMVNIVQFILPSSRKREFKNWLNLTSERLDKIAPIPNMVERDHRDFDTRHEYNEYKAPRRGSPLPPVVLDPSVDVSGIDLAAEAAKFIASLDHTKNRYLKSPDEMIAEGFEGVPYGMPK